MSAVAQADNANWDVRPLTGVLGAEGRGVDVETLDDEGFAAVHALLLQYSAIALHGQGHLTVPKLREFGMRWGKLDVHGFRAFEGFDDVLCIRCDPDNPLVTEQRLS